MGKGLPQRWQLRSPGGLATPQAGLAQRLGGPSGSAAAPSPCTMKPQSMHATAPSRSVEPHEGHLVGVAGLLGAATGPFATAGAGLGAAGAAVAGIAAAGAPAACKAGTANACLHDGHWTCLPAAWSGT